MRLELHWRSEDGIRLPMALWRPGPGYQMISSGIVGGGLGPREWVLNAQVAGGYDRTDPVVHRTDLAAGLGLSGPGIGMLTAAQVTAVVRREDEGAHVAATVGLRVPTPDDRRGGPGEDFAGPRSLWGARIARAVHAAVYAGALDYASGLPSARPQVFINLVPDHVISHRMYPVGGDRTKVVCDWLFTPGVVETGQDMSRSVELFDRVNRQDFEACERTQPSMTSRAYRDGGVPVPSEHHIAEFHDWVTRHA
jgi:hypothetical protein